MFKMEDCKETTNPIATNCFMDADEVGHQWIQPNIEQRPNT